MYCPQCGSPLEEGASFCSQCATPIKKKEIESTGRQEPERDSSIASEKSPNSSLAKKIGIGVGCIALIIGIGMIVVVNSGFFSGAPSGTASTEGLFYDGPSEEQVMDDLNFSETAHNLSYEGAWYPYQEPTFSYVSDFELLYDESDMKEFTVTAVYESNDLETESTVLIDYEKINGEWVVVDSLETSRSVVPTATPDQDSLISHVPSMMQIADEMRPVFDSDNNPLELTDLYGDNFSICISDTEFHSDGIACAAIDITASDGLTSYIGQLQATLEWDGDDWVIADCFATEGSYIADYSALIGTWIGEYDESSSSSFNCYAGRYNPARMTIKSIDSLSKTARADFTILVHNHEPSSSTNPSNNSPGDEIVAIENALVNLNLEYDDFRIYSGNQPCDFYIKFDQSHGLAVVVYSFFSDANMFTYPHDAFVMTKE